MTCLSVYVYVFTMCFIRACQRFCNDKKSALILVPRITAYDAARSQLR